MMENDTQNSQQAASTALHNAPKLAKIAQAGVQGGPAGAATEAAEIGRASCRERV